MSLDNVGWIWAMLPSSRRRRANSVVTCSLACRGRDSVSSYTNTPPWEVTAYSRRSFAITRKLFGFVGPIVEWIL